MLIQILIDNPRSWMVPHGKQLTTLIESRGHNCTLIHSHEDIREGDILVLLSCEKILKNLSLNKFNLVVHESSLPEGKGWSPLSWQILEGRNQIPITLFEAAEHVDAGRIYLQDVMEFRGDELVDELRAAQAKKTIELILRFLDGFPLQGSSQTGAGSVYRKRTPGDSRLDPEKSIADQFNLLRICDNERYPAFFEYKGHNYIIKIFKK